MQVYDINYIKHICAENGVKLLSKEYLGLRKPIFIECIECGEKTSFTLDVFNKKGVSFKCSKCRKKGFSDFDIEKIFKENNVNFIRKEEGGTKLYSKYFFNCIKCGKEISITFKSLRAKSYGKFCCRSCQKESLKPKIEDLKEEFKNKGSELLTNFYISDSQDLEFKCSKCGQISRIKYSSMKKGENKNLLCPHCNPCQRRYTYDEIKQIFEGKGAELVSKEYKNFATPLEFKCRQCGKIHKITLGHLLSGENKNMLCEDCLGGSRYNPDGSYGLRHYRKLVDSQWFEYVMEFFNIQHAEYYAAHHILRFTIAPEFKRSIINGFPLLNIYHSKGFYEENIKWVNPFHTYIPFRNPENWPEYVKLPYHNYEGFKFYNFNKKFLTDIIYKDTNTRNLFKIKEEYSRKGMLYIPIYFEELFLKRKAQIVYSIIRNKLYKYYPDVYKYTGCNLRKYGARQLKLDIIKPREGREFFEYNHIQGPIGGEVYIGLSYNNEIIQVMEFGKSRSSLAEVELLRFATKINSLVLGGAHRLFDFYIKTYCPSKVVSFCDIRFSSINPDETIYPKLGFKYIGYSKPNYKWLNPKINRLFSRQLFQKHLLEKKLDNFDPKLSETQNMEANGYIKLYDCGNHIFLWEGK